MDMDWEYTRSWRTHYIDEDGTFYKGKFHLWDILNCTPYGFINQYDSQGHDLYHKGKFVKHGKTVKELKIYVSEQALKENN